MNSETQWYNTLCTTIQLVLLLIILFASQSDSYGRRAEGLNPYGPAVPTTWVIRNGIPFNALTVSDDPADDPAYYKKYN